MILTLQVIGSIVTVLLIAAFIKGARGELYTYTEEKDEDGNIIEKVIDHRDKGED